MFEFDEMDGFDLLGADQMLLIPKAGANYTDAKTVAAVQSALVKKGYDLGTSGAKGDGVDGYFGSKTKKAIEKLQKDVGYLVTGTINEDVIRTLKVTPGVLPPGVSAQQVIALQAQIALNNATKAEHAKTPGEVQQAAQETVNFSSAMQVSPELRQAAIDALAVAQKATTPEQVKLAAAKVQEVAAQQSAAVTPSWWTLPAWSGGWPRWQVGAVAGGSAVGLGLILFAIFGGKSSTTAASQP